METDLLYKDEAYKIVGACYEVYNNLGCGFLESVYQKTLELELRISEVPFVSQQPIEIFYKGAPINQTCVPDFICYEKIILEIKAESKLCSANRSQVLNYLKATGYRLGLLVNFGNGQRLEWERLIV